MLANALRANVTLAFLNLANSHINVVGKEGDNDQFSLDDSRDPSFFGWGQDFLSCALDCARMWAWFTWIFLRTSSVLQVVGCSAMCCDNQQRWSKWDCLATILVMKDWSSLVRRFGRVKAVWGYKYSTFRSTRSPLLGSLSSSSRSSATLSLRRSTSQGISFIDKSMTVLLTSLSPVRLSEI